MNRPKEPKSNLHFVKNLTNRSKSTKNNSDENTLRSKLVQKSILKFLSCSTHSPHQNPIKIVPKTITNCSQKSNLNPAINHENAQKYTIKRGKRKHHLPPASPPVDEEEREAG